VVASQDQFFGPGDTIVTRFTVDDLPPLSEAPTTNFVPGDINIVDPPNVITLQATEVGFLPSTPESYFLGVIVDPDRLINEISEGGGEEPGRLSLLRRVGPNTTGLPPAGVNESPSTNLFPIPPYTSMSTTVPLPGPDLSTTSLGRRILPSAGLSRNQLGLLRATNTFRGLPSRNSAAILAGRRLLVPPITNSINPGIRFGNPGAQFPATQPPSGSGGDTTGKTS
jgi:hypothetical protein